MIKMDVELPDYLMSGYKPGRDSGVCTDFTGRHRLLADLGIRCWTEEFHRCRDEGFYFRLVRSLPPGARFVVEVRTGLWAGDGVSHEFRDMAEALDISEADVREIYERALDVLWPLANHGERRPTTHRAAEGAPSQKPKRKHKDRRKVSPRVRFEVFQEDEYRCRICGVSADSGAVLHIDHIIPVSRGGTNEKDNLQTLCAECNFGKRDRLMQ